MDRELVLLGALRQVVLVSPASVVRYHGAPIVVEGAGMGIPWVEPSTPELLGRSSAEQLTLARRSGQFAVGTS